MVNRLGENRAGELTRLAIDMAGSFLATTVLHSRYQPEVGIHLAQAFESLHVSHIGQKARAVSGVIPLIVMSRFTSSSRGSPASKISR